MKNVSKKNKTLPAMRVSESLYEGITELKDIMNSSYFELLTEDAIRHLNRGYKLNQEQVKKLYGLNVTLIEKGFNSLTHEGEVIDIYEPNQSDLYKANRPYVYIHLLSSDGTKSSFGIWGFGNPLKVRGKSYFVEDFIVATRRSCLICGTKLKRVLSTTDSKGRDRNFVISSGKSFYRVCEKCFQKDKEEPMKLELI